MHLTYLPISRRQCRKVQIDAGHVPDRSDANAGWPQGSIFFQSTGGIHYLEENSYEFYGNELLYDGDKSLVSIAGDAAIPCLVNGVIVDSIAYNLSNGNVKTQGLRGGAVPVPPKKAK